MANGCLFKGYFIRNGVPYYSVAMNLSGKTALVTGAAHRIGRATAVALARAGASVVVHYRSSEAAATAAVEELKGLGVDAHTIGADLASESDALELVPRAIELAERLDILVNSASIFEEATLESVEQVDFRRNFAVNAMAPFTLMRELYRHLKGRGSSGVAVNLLDTRITDFDRKHVAYAVSKRALHTLTRMSADEFAPVLRVNAVAPGLVLPPAGQEADYLERLRHTNPLERYGSVDEVTNAILFLVDNEFVTGQTIWVDGGRHLRGSFYGN